MRWISLLLLLVFALPTHAYQCQADGRTGQLVQAVHGQETLGDWIAQGSQVQTLKLPNGLTAGVLIEPLTREQHLQRFPDRQQIFETVKITIYDLSGEAPEEIVVGWAGANSWQKFGLKAFGPGRLDLILTKAVCIDLDRNPGNLGG